MTDAQPPSQRNSRNSDEPSENPWTTHSSAVRYENPWIKVVHNEVTNPGGGAGQYGVVHFKNRAVAVIPIDAENHTWMVGQFRFAVESYEWEVPAGGAPHDETILECAKRELLEETGLVAEHWDLILDGIQLSNSVTDERAYCFVARGLSQQEASPEECEELSLKRVSLEDAIDWAITGKLRDGFSVVSLMRLKLLMLRGELRSIHD